MPMIDISRSQTQEFMKKLYLKINEYNRFDDFYIPLSCKDDTWKEILDHIESSLDDKYLDNDKSILGIKFSMEVVDETPEDLDTDF